MNHLKLNARQTSRNGDGKAARASCWRWSRLTRGTTGSCSPKTKQHKEEENAETRTQEAVWMSWITLRSMDIMRTWIFSHFSLIASEFWASPTALKKLSIGSEYKREDLWYAEFIIDMFTKAWVNQLWWSGESFPWENWHVSLIALGWPMGCFEVAQSKHSNRSVRW